MHMGFILSACISVVPTGKISVKFDIGVVLQLSVKELRIWLKSDDNIRHLHGDRGIFYVIDSSMKYFVA